MPDRGDKVEIGVPRFSARAEGGTAAKLVLIAGSERAEHSLKPGETIFGRSASADISIEDPLVSRRHCRIAGLDQGWVLIDLNSQNGTLVNGIRVTQSELHHGDQVQIGSFTFFFSENGQTPPLERVELIQPATSPEAWPEAFEIESQPLPAPTPAAASGASHSLQAGGSTVLRVLVKGLVLGSVVLTFLALLLVGLVRLSPEESAEAEFQKLFQTELSQETLIQVESLLAQAHGYAEEGNDSLALEHYQKILVLDAGNQTALSETARIEERRISEADARARAQEERRQRAAQVAGLVEQADVRMDEGDAIGARGLLEQALAIEPESRVVQMKIAESHVAEGERYRRGGDEARAREQFQAALAVDPENSKAERGISQMSVARRQAQQKKKQIELLARKGKSQLENEDYIEAYATFSKVLRLDPRNKQAKALQVESRRRLAQKAQPIYEDAVRLYQDGRQDAAVARFKEVLSIYPDHRESREYLSRVGGELRKRAVEFYKRAYIYEGLGRLDEALALYEKALGLLTDPEDEYYRKAAAKIESLQKGVRKP